MPYELNFNWQQTAGLEIAISFWERKEVKNKVAEFFESCNMLNSHESKRKWPEFTKSIIDEWNKDAFLHMLKAELIHLVRMIGQIIFNWYQYIKDEYGATKDAMSFIDEIKWTPYGTIYEVETFKSSLLNNPNVDITKVYNFACHYAITDHINELWNKIPHDKQNDCYKNVYKQVDQHILAYWKCCRENNLPNLIKYCQAAAKNFNEVEMDDFNSILNEEQVLHLLYYSNLSIDANMLRLTVYQGHFNAMKYFWDKLTEEEMEESVLKCARICVLRWNYYADEFKNTNGYIVYQYIEIWIFLMSQMKSYDRKSFFNQKLMSALRIPDINQQDMKSRILWMLLSTWPWEELFMPILKDMLHCIDDGVKMDCMFLDAITFQMSEDHDLGYSLETNKYRSLLREAWLIIPTPIKRKIPQANPFFGFINNLIDVWDLDNLNLIINDPAIADVRDQFINSGKSSYDKLVVCDQFEKLDQLMEQLFKFNEEQKKPFKQNLNPWRKIFENRVINVADKFLDWQSNTQEERRFLKNNINHMELCTEFTNNSNFRALDEFLNWKFETIEERIRCEDHFKNDIFVIKKVYDMWKLFRGNIDFAKKRSSEFLNWVFKSDEEIRYFKKEKLINIEINQSVIDGLVMLREFRAIDEFLSWCLLDGTEIEQIKRVISVGNPRLT